MLGPFSFCEDFKALVDTEDLYVKTLRLTNSVLHCNTDCKNSDFTRERDRVYARQFNKKGPIRSLYCTTNDNVKGPNYRIDAANGRFLCFMQAGNQIRAGPATPSDAIATLYRFHATVLSTADNPVYPDFVAVPNVVACGKLKGKVSGAFETSAVVNSSQKFPGRSVTLNTGSTPVCYPKRSDGTDGLKFIMPGLVSPEQAAHTVQEFSAITQGTLRK